MARTNLKSSLGIPLYFTGDEIQSEQFKSSNISVIDIEDIRPQLLNHDLDCPEIFYVKYKDLDNENEKFKKANLRVNLYLMKPNLAGIEYVKSKATKCSKYPRLFEIVYGGGTLLLQKYISAKENKIFKIHIKKGTKLIVPPGYSICLINTRQTSTLIAVEISSRDARTRVVLEDKRGMSYYIIRKNAKVEVVRNPAYKIVKNIDKLDIEKILKEKRITPKTPLIKQVFRNNERFDWLFKESDMDF